MYSVGNRLPSERLLKLFDRFIGDEAGATAIEYGLIAVLVSVAIIIGVTAVGSTLANNFYDTYADKLASGGSSTP